jgi:uncharacterized protein
LKQAISLIIITALVSFSGCKSNPAANQLTSADNAAVKDTAKRTEDTVPGYQPDDTLVIPNPQGLVNDFSGLFTPDQRETLKRLVNDYDQQTTIEMAIVTLTPGHVSHQNFDHYTLQLANRWGVGKKDKNNGVLVAIAPELGRMRIQNGFGIEKIMSNEETKTIIDSFFIPQFKQGEYFRGTMQGVTVLMERLKGRQ